MGKSLSVIKRIRQSETKRERNLLYKDELKKAKKTIRKLLVAAAGKEELMKAYAEYTSAVDSSVKKNIIHKNNAARKKSRMNALLKKHILGN